MSQSITFMDPLTHRAWRTLWTTSRWTDKRILWWKKC